MSDIIEKFNRYAGDYDRWYDTHAPAFDSELAALKKVIPVTGTGLEVGVGTGRFARALGIQYGVDPAPGMVKQARLRGIKALEARGDTLPFKNRTFDFAALITTLCFLPDPQPVLEEIHRVLKPGGRIVLGMIDGDSFLGRYYREKEGTFFRHAHLFSVDDAIHLLTASGFLPGQPYQTLFGLPTDMVGTDSPREGTGEGGFCVIPGEKK